VLKSLSTLRKVADCLGTKASLDTPVTGVSIDTRTLKPGDLFFALRGERDGHQFVGPALESGAAGAVVAASSGLDGERILAVKDPQAALQGLGAESRRRWAKRVVCITGSAGKTTTKEMVAAVLAAKFRVCKSEGNLNNHLGLPLSLLSLEDSHEVAVFELAMSHAGEIRELAKWAAPNVGVVTNVAPVHLEFFDSVEAIARAKYELIEALDPATGVAVLNADDPRVARFAFAGRVLTCGIEQEADFRAVNIQQEQAESFEVCGIRLAVHLPGRHNILNALAALAVASEFAIPPGEAAGALESFQPARMRGERLEHKGIVIINDCYNSNPQAALSMLDWLRAAPVKGRRLAVLGEMLELGPAGPDLHREVGARAARCADLLVGVRGLAAQIVEGARAAGLPAASGRFVETPDEAADLVAAWARPGDTVLFKASRGVRLERAIARLTGKVVN
jgi:UDP-N-acetylmuramoyl-tripeptide--D-alanyl-D-alanine ligase